MPGLAGHPGLCCVFIQSDVDGRDKPGQGASYRLFAGVWPSSESVGRIAPRVLDRKTPSNPDREIPMPIVNRVADLQPDIQAWRRDIHEHPELLYDVHRTAAFVAERLREFGCDEVATGLGRTGVVGVIKGRKPAGRGDIKVIGLRADMDALPIDEETNLAYASKTPGKMHACAHARQ